MCLNHISLINWSQNGWKSSPEMICAKKKSNSGKNETNLKYIKKITAIYKTMQVKNIQVKKLNKLASYNIYHPFHQLHLFLIR